jgi:predicted  nucleic acid-binding Zn-ribbon protein
MRKRRNNNQIPNPDNERITMLRNELDTACKIIDIKNSEIRKLNNELTKLQNENTELINKIEEVDGIM